MAANKNRSKSMNKSKKNPQESCFTAICSAAVELHLRYNVFDQSIYILFLTEDIASERKCLPKPKEIKEK